MELHFSVVDQDVVERTRPQGHNVDTMGLSLMQYIAGETRENAVFALLHFVVVVGER